jgi:hypothetical protein
VWHSRKSKYVAVRPELVEGRTDFFTAPGATREDRLASSVLICRRRSYVIGIMICFWYGGRSHSPLYQAFKWSNLGCSMGRLNQR